MFVVLAFCGLAQASGSDSSAVKLTSSEVAQAQKAGLTALKASIDEPEQRQPKLHWAASPVWSNSGPTHQALLVASMTYADAQYAYCRLVTLTADLKTASVIDAQSMPDCKGISKVFFVDLDGHGQLDVIANLRVPSNRYDTVLDVPAVFLADPASPGGYCYSQQASDRLQPVDMASEGRAKSSLQHEQARLGLPRFACGGA